MRLRFIFSFETLPEFVPPSSLNRGPPQDEPSSRDFCCVHIDRVITGR